MRTIVLDKFVGANGTALAAHSPEVGGPWTDTNPGLKLLNGKCVGTDANGTSTIPINARSLIVTFGVDLNGCDAGSNVQVYLEASLGGGSGMLFQGKGDGTVWGSSTSNGTAQCNGEINDALPLAGTAEVKMILSPGSQKFYVDGVLIEHCQRYFDPDITISTLSLLAIVAAGTYPKFSKLLVIGCGS